MPSRSRVSLICALLVLPGLPAQDNSAPKFDMSVENIMRGPALYGYSPQNLRWSGDSRRLFFRWKRHDEPLHKEYSAYVVNHDGTYLRKLTEEEEKDAPPAFGDDTRDWKLTVYSRGGDLFLYDHLTNRRRQLTKTSEAETNPRFTQDGQRIAFTRGNNLYVLSPREGMIEQITDIRAPGAAAPSPAPTQGTGRFGALFGGSQTSAQTEDAERKGTESQEYLKKAERDLLEAVRERSGKREEDEAKRKKETPRKPFRLSARQSVAGLQLSPDESFVSAMIIESAEGSKTSIVPNYVTESGYTTDISARTKVGDAQRRTRLALIDVRSGDVKWVEHPIEEGPAKDGKERDRELILDAPRWSEDGQRAFVTGSARDNKDAWIFALDPKASKLRTLVAMHDDAWVGGPTSQAGDAGWLPDNRRIYFTWERDGWAHLYTIDHGGGEPKQLTSGKWEVRDVALNNQRTHFLITTSEAHAGEEHLYRLGFDGAERKRLTTMPGGHRALVSPDGATLASIYSYTNKPPEVYLQDLTKPAAAPVKVTDSPAPEFRAYPWSDVPIVEIPARDGAKVPARMYKPANWKRGGPLVIFVHGAGYLQNVHRRWSNYGREYMFHHLLMERGYLVLDLDYRASAGYGRDWRTAIYRHMGGKDLDDQIDAVKWAVSEHGVDPKRAGIYGGSYGGFITLMAMFTQPDVFAAGASLRPVTDWAHYNHPYTSNILNLPQKDAEAYRRSSPIYHAQGLKGALLICHGMVDVNVHFQDTVRLVQRLIELGKQNWELAVYPVEDHGFVQPSSWTDEYKRILKLFETNLRAR
jgi:dipeptidyl aminopeptidase/acylaminoacyl peptidase